MRRTLLVLAVLTLAAAACPPAQADVAKRACSQVLRPMKDGVRLHGWVNREDPVRPRPVLLTITSYTNSGCPGGSSYYVSPAVANQMSMVFISMRGTGASEGTFDLFGQDTKRDIDDVLDWIVAQPWSDGSIVLAGASGNGLFMMDALAHPAVKAAVAETACSDLYRCGCGGLRFFPIMFSHGRRFPLADPLPHKGLTVSFPYILAFHE